MNKCTYKPDCPWYDGRKCNSPNNHTRNECDYDRGIFPERDISEQQEVLKAKPCDDTISRQAAIVQLSHNKIGDDDCDVVIQNDIETIKALPSAQPEIIRCKDCKYCDRGIDEDLNPFLKCLGWVYGGTQEEDFCSHAERRTDETD